MTGRTQNDNASAGDWRALLVAREWKALNGLWPHLPVGEQRKLFDELRRVVPKIVVEDGVEHIERQVWQNETTDEWRGATKILERGELEIAIKGERPKTAGWVSLRQEAEMVMYAHLGVDLWFRDDPKPGDIKELSAKWHAGRVLGNLMLFDQTVADALHRMEGESNRLLLAETLALIAAQAFDVGRHTQAASGKRFEPHALRGVKQIKAASDGGKRRAATLKERTRLTVAELKRLIAEGHKPDRAAILAHKSGFGKSVGANRQLLTRYGLRKKVGT